MKWARKISIIDILIIFVIIGVSFYILKPFRSKVDIAKNTTSIVYTFETNGVGEEFIAQLEKGKDLFNSSKHSYLGKIKDFRVNPYKERFEDKEKGIITIITYPEQYSVHIDIEADAIIENDVVMVDREEIRVGLYLPIKGKGFVSFGYIINVER